MQKFDFILVDDDWLTIYINKINLEHFGNADKIVSIMNGKEAVEYITNIYKDIQGKCTPVIVLLDINMPAMDGFEVLDALVEFSEDLFYKIKIYMLSSTQYPKDLERIKSYPNVDFIPKPLSIEKLEAMMQ